MRSSRTIAPRRSTPSGRTRARSRSPSMRSSALASVPSRPALRARGALRQAGHRLAPRLGARPAPPALHAVVREAARAYELLGLVAYLMMDSTASLAANLRALNLSETVPASPELATSC